jgi:hypothetical protein
MRQSTVARIRADLPGPPHRAVSECYPLPVVGNFHIVLDFEGACLSIASEFTVRRLWRAPSNMPARSKASQSAA